MSLAYRDRQPVWGERDGIGAPGRGWNACPLGHMPKARVLRVVPMLEVDGDPPEVDIGPADFHESTAAMANAGSRIGVDVAWAVCERPAGGRDSEQVPHRIAYSRCDWRTRGYPAVRRCRQNEHADVRAKAKSVGNSEIGVDEAPGGAE